jgi:hypothetical protein
MILLTRLQMYHAHILDTVLPNLDLYLSISSKCPRTAQFLEARIAIKYKTLKFTCLCFSDS